MKRFVVVLALMFLAGGFPVCAESVTEKPAEEVELPNIFIWAIPDDEEQPEAVDKKEQKESTAYEENTELQTEDEEEPVVLNAATLKGYAEYIEGAEDILYMEDFPKFTLNIKTPQKITSENIAGSKMPVYTGDFSLLSKYKSDEYSISPRSRNFTAQDGNWSYGTSFNSEISTSQLENATSLFTKYENKYFSLSSNYKKNNLTTAQIQTDNFSVTPEVKLGNYFSIRDVLSKDITRNRQSSELIFSVNPFGAKDTDRMRFDIGAKQTYDVNTGNTWSQLNFTTNFRL